MGKKKKARNKQIRITFTIDEFFSKKFENDSTHILLNHKPYFSEEVVRNYIDQIHNIPIHSYIHYLIDHPNLDEITSKDITQLSSFDDCTQNICNVMKENENRGMSFTEIATALHAENEYKDTIGALTKYGENQVKTASQLGLAVYKNELWYLTAVGYIFSSVKDSLQKKYLALTQLRDPFYSKVILSLLNKDTNLKDFMTILSESTQKRRNSSCKKVLSYFIEQCHKEKVIQVSQVP